MGRVDIFRKKGEAYSRDAVKHAFEEMTTRMARLSSFARPPHLNVHGFVSNKADLLAVDDLIAFAIHTRRFVEASDGGELAKSTGVPLLDVNTRQLLIEVSKSQRTLTIWEVLNKLIHSTHVHVCTSYFGLTIVERYLKNNWPPFGESDLLDVFEKNKDRALAGATALVFTDGSKLFFFDVGEFLHNFDAYVFEPLVEYWDEIDSEFLGVELF